VVDYLALCEVAPSATLTLGNLVWNDANKNGVRETGANAEFGVGNLDLDIYRTTNSVIGDGDDVLVNTTKSSPTGAYSFTGLVDGKYYVRLMPPAAFATGGAVVTTDNQINNDNNGSQPGGPGTFIFSPVITLSSGLEPTNDGDSDPDTDLSVDFAVFSGVQLGDLLFHDANNDGIFSSGTETGVGAGVAVELLNNAGAVIGNTVTGSSGQYSFRVYNAGQYRVRVPNAPAAYPIVSSIYDGADNAEDHDNNAAQPGGKGTAAITPLIALTPGGEPGSSGFSNDEMTVDLGFRACPAISITPGTLALATQYSVYNLALSSTGGAGGYT
jgi:hypothetical protein